METRRVAAVHGGFYRVLRSGWFPPVVMVALGLLVFAPFYVPSGYARSHSEVHWDTLAYHYPMLSYASDAIRAGEFPLWNPFQDLGFPYLVDPQTQLWSPVTWLVSVALGYDLMALQYQLVGVLLLAGLGAYAASRALGAVRWAAWCAGVSYMYCGYFVSGASLFGTISTMAWFPWVVACVARAMRAPLRRAVGWSAAAGVLLAQCAVGGHPTTALVAAFNLGLLILFWSGGRHRPAARVGLLALTGALAALMAMPQVAGVFWLREQFPHLGDYPLQMAEQDPWMARGLIGLLIPALPYFHASFLPGTHPAHLGAYAGIALFIGLPLALAARGRRRLPWLFAILALINLLAALGPATVFRQLLYYAVPGMKLPHHAMMDFRGFALLFGFLTAVFGWQMLFAALRAHHAVLARVRRPLYAVGGVFLLLGLCALVADAAGFTSAQPAVAPPWGEDLVGPGLLGEQFIVGALLCALFGLSLKPRRLSRVAPLLFCLVVFFDMTSSVKHTWTLMADVIGLKLKHELLDLDARRPYTFDPAQFTDLREREAGWEGLILHHVELNAYNPPATLIPREERPLGRAKLAERYGDFMPARAVLRPSGAAPKLVSFGPNHLTWRIEDPDAEALQVLSSWTPGWWATVEGGDPVAVMRGHDPHVLHVPLPPGTREVELRFSPTWVRPTVLAMAAGYAIAFALMLVGFVRRRPR